MEPIFSPEELAQVRAYAAPFYLWLALRDGVVLGVYLALLRFGIRPMFRLAEATAEGMERRLGASRRLPVLRAVPAALEKLWGGPGWGAALLFALIWVLALHAVFLPRAVFFDYVHEHRFGLSNYTPGAYALDVGKALVLSAVAQCFLAFGLLGLARRTRAWWMLLGGVAAVAMLGSPLLDPYRSQLYFEQAPLEAGALREEISGLLSRAEVAYRDVIVEKTSRASKQLQAYFAGQGPTRTVVLNDVLVETLQADEVLAAVAHEAGHLSESRWVGRALGSLALVAFLFLAHHLLWLTQRRGWFGVSRYGDARALPLVTVALWVLLSLGHPVGAAISRERERKADLYALELTKDPAAFRRMLVKAARTNKLDPDPPRWAVLRSHSHPPVGERLRAVAAWEALTATGKTESR